MIRSPRGRSVALVLFASIGASLGCGGSGGGSRGSASLASTAAVGTNTGGTTTGGTAAPVGSAAGATTATNLAPAVTQPAAGSWLKGDMHIHTTYSGDATQIGDGVAGVIACCEKAGLDWASLTDHRTTAILQDPAFTQAKTPLTLIAGEEWGQPGHAGAHGLTRDPIYHAQDETQGPAVCVQKIKDAIDDVHSMGGVFTLNHPIDNKTPWLWDVAGFDGVEVWNSTWALRSALTVGPSTLQQWAQSHQISMTPEALAAAQVQAGGQNLQRLAFYDAHLAAGRHVAAVGGSDTHYIFLPGHPTTLVYSSDRTPKGILDAIRAGRTQVRRAADAPDVELSADRDGDGVFESLIGDSIPLASVSAAKPATFKIRVKDDLGGKVELVKNGKVVQTWPVTSPDFVVTWQDAPAARSFYRLNVYEPLDMSFPGASTLKKLVVGGGAAQWIQLLTQGALSQLLGGKLAALATKGQIIMDSGGPALLWILTNGPKAGVKVSNVSTRFPRIELPKNVEQVLNVAVHDDAFGMGVVTSPIWIE